MCGIGVLSSIVFEIRLCNTIFEMFSFALSQDQMFVLVLL